MTGSTIAGSTSNPGSALAQLNSPSTIYIDPNRVMFILDTSNFRVVRWNFGEPRGHLVLGGNGNGAGLNQMGWSYGMFVDPQYNIYISDNSNHRVTLWLSTNRSFSILVISLAYVCCHFHQILPLLVRLRVAMVPVIQLND